MNRKYPFRNLVFKGGGIKAFAYIGAMQAFEEHEMLDQIDRVAGTSAGSLMATIISFRKPAQQTGDIFSTLDYSKIASLVAEEEQQGEMKFTQVIKKHEQKIRGGVNAISRLYQDFGLFSTESLAQWLEGVIAEECDGNGRATFADFKRFGYRDLHIVATNISTHQVNEFSAAKTPDIPVAEAAIASSSIPIFFEPYKFEAGSVKAGDYFVDGGVLTNYPIHIFDHSRYKQNNPDYKDGVNWQTLGCRLFTPEECKEEIVPIISLPTFVKNLVETLSISEDVAFQTTLIDKLRTINISNCCVDTTDFTVRPGTPKYEQLISAGWSATNDFLESYQSPENQRSSIWEKFRGLFNA